MSHYFPARAYNKFLIWWVLIMEAHFIKNYIILDQNVFWYLKVYLLKINNKGAIVEESHTKVYKYSYCELYQQLLAEEFTWNAIKL